MFFCTIEMGGKQIMSDFYFLMFFCCLFLIKFSRQFAFLILNRYDKVLKVEPEYKK
jgi:hypothetical protein